MGGSSDRGREEGGKVISNLCHMTKGCEATMSQETEAGAPQKAEVSMGQEIGE